MKGFFSSDFWGFGGYKRTAEGYFSWQHLTFVTILMAIMVGLAVVLGRRNRNRSMSVKNRPLIWAAIIMDGTEIAKVALKCTIGNDPQCWMYALPLFLCSIHLITMPIAAFSKGRLKEASLDFLFLFGLIGAVLGTYAAGNNYSCYPVLSLDNVASGITHSSIGFAALYIVIAQMVSMKKENLWITVVILLAFCLAAHIANGFIGCNYMFMMRGDGTPYDILYNLVGGHPVVYPIMVVVLFLIYIAGFYAVYFWMHRHRNAVAQENIGA